MKVPTREKFCPGSLCMIHSDLDARIPIWISANPFDTQRLGYFQPCDMLFIIDRSSDPATDLMFYVLTKFGPAWVSEKFIEWLV